MRSSTSSSEQRLPRTAWPAVLGGALLMLLVFVWAQETLLARRGYHAAVEDTPALWAQQRRRAAALGPRALILVGASRMQTGIDLPQLRRLSGLEPVQLAIDGSSFLPVLRDLAADPAVTGTVLVDWDAAAAANPARQDAASRYVDWYHKQQAAGPVLDFDTLEDALQQPLQARLRSYAGGARPLDSLLRRLLNPHPTPQYVTILPDRSRLADFSQVDLPLIYYGRVCRTLGVDLLRPGITPAELEALVAERVHQLQPADSTGFAANAQLIDALAARLRGRGARVLFVAMPTSGWVRIIEERRYPRQRFWDVFAAASGSPTLNFEDLPALRDAQLPDGSHLDYRDRGAFTTVLAQALGLSAGSPSPAP